MNQFKKKDNRNTLLIIKINIMKMSMEMKMSMMKKTIGIKNMKKKNEKKVYK
jgi:hypothetical protein